MQKMRRQFPGSAPPGDKFLSVLSDNAMKL
jgi:hypothetical protein